MTTKTRICKSSGFGDSKGCRATEDSVVSDCHDVLEWCRSTYPSHHIVVWGHSLGTGIATRFLHSLHTAGDLPASVRALILESAFLSAKAAAKCFPAAKYWDYLKLTRDRIPRSMDHIFPTDRLLPVVAETLPVLLVHAVDDSTVPHSHSVALRERCSGLVTGGVGSVGVDLFSAATGQHRFVMRDEEAVEMVTRFVDVIAPVK